MILLQTYPGLEDRIIGMAPPFKNLKNPLLRRTVGKIATLEKIAQIGNIDAGEFVNSLRLEVGLPELAGESITAPKPEWDAADPEWIKGEPKVTVNGTEMLSRGEHPLAFVNEQMRNLEGGQYLLLHTNFKPLPLIDAMQKQGYLVFNKADAKNPDQHYTFIGR